MNRSLAANDASLASSSYFRRCGASPHRRERPSEALDEIFLSLSEI